MRDRIGTFFNFTIPKLLWVCILFLTFGEYSNYTSPVDFEETTELLVYSEESSSRPNTIAFQQYTTPKSNNTSYNSHKYLKLLVLHHDRLRFITEKNQLLFTHLFNQQKIIRFLSCFSRLDKEDFFYFHTIG